MNTYRKIELLYHEIIYCVESIKTCSNLAIAEQSSYVAVIKHRIETVKKCIEKIEGFSNGENETN